MVLAKREIERAPIGGRVVGELTAEKELAIREPFYIPDLIVLAARRLWRGIVERLFVEANGQGQMANLRSTVLATSWQSFQSRDPQQRERLDKEGVDRSVTAHGDALAVNRREIAVRELARAAVMEPRLPVPVLGRHIVRILYHNDAQILSRSGLWVESDKMEQTVGTGLFLQETDDQIKVAVRAETRVHPRVGARALNDGAVLRRGNAMALCKEIDLI